MASDSANRSAAGVATLRYLSSWDDPVANPDRLCGAFLSRPMRLLGAVPPLRRRACRLIRRRFPGGIEYQAARTRHIDAVLTRAVAERVTQLVILGVGYDTRPYRFRRELAGVRVFEVDHPVTLARRARIAARRLPPVEAVRVGVDFDRHDLGSRLDRSGFRSDQPTLFIWEGVTMFIGEESVHETLARVGATSGGEVVFDYVARSALENPAAHYGGAQAARHFRRTGEPWRFGIEPGRVAALLDRHGLAPRSHLGPAQLQAAYLEDVGGVSDGRVPTFHGIVHAALN
ncbi:MAG TPA: SAM-dependent methyltransferase [Solirubrobacterales bacterium]|nr:SAM-dependent methyltransferase [Solirubrobacterales bacterium]